MITFRASDYTYKSKEMGSKRDFYIIEPMGVPFREYLTVNRGALSEENEFAINVQFASEAQTSPFRQQSPGVLPAINTRSRQNF
jgi:hypothetical protein